MEWKSKNDEVFHYFFKKRVRLYEKGVRAYLYLLVLARTMTINRQVKGAQQATNASPKHAFQQAEFMNKQ